MKWFRFRDSVFVSFYSVANNMELVTYENSIIHFLHTDLQVTCGPARLDWAQPSLGLSHCLPLSAQAEEAVTIWNMELSW